MLKITTLIHAESTTFKLEGCLAGLWVQELERCWDSVVGTMTSHLLTVDLSAVTYTHPEPDWLIHCPNRTDEGWWTGYPILVQLLLPLVLVLVNRLLLVQLLL